jgi:hypothetical protein
MPASWQDTGSGVFTLAATGLLAGLGPLGHLPARRTTTYAVTAALAAARRGWPIDSLVAVAVEWSPSPAHRRIGGAGPVNGFRQAMGPARAPLRCCC